MPVELRLALWYAVALGGAAAGPWYVLLLTRRGWSDAAATLIVAALPLGRLVGGPAWGWLADRAGATRVLRVVTTLSAACGVALLWSADPVVTAAWLVGLSAVRTPAYPLVDALAVERLGAGYGRTRAWGSGAFLVVGAVHGVLDGTFPAIAWWTAAALGVATVGATGGLPPAGTRPVPADVAWWRDPALRWLVGVSGVHGVSLAVYDHLFALHVAALELPGWCQGLALATGVAAEIVVFRTSPRWFGRASPWTWLLVGVAAGIPRYLLSAVVVHPVGLALLQAFHGLHFGLFWLAATALFTSRAPPGRRNTVVALLPTSMFGLGPLVALVASSAFLSRTHETPALLVAAAGVAGVGAVLAGVARARA